MSRGSGAALLVLAVGGALLRGARWPPPAADAGRRARRLGRVEWAIALARARPHARDVRGRAGCGALRRPRPILRPTASPTRSTPARGFFELEAVAALTLGVVAATARWARREGPGEERLARLLLGLLCALTLVVLASALQRLWLYVDAFGATRLRFLVQAQLLWLAAVFAALLVAGARRAG